MSLRNILNGKFESQGKLKNVFCYTCKVALKRFDYEIEKYRHLFCSRKCKHEWLKSEYRGAGNHFFGKKHTTKSIEKIKKNHAGMDGKKHTEKTKNKMSEIAKKNGFGKWWKGRKQSPEHNKNSGESRRGEKNWNWKGGITPERKRLYFSKEYKLWRNAVFERDSHTCIWCGQVGGVLNADHIKSWCDYPELRFAIDNGRTLCLDCHRKTDTWGVKKNFRKILADRRLESGRFGEVKDMIC